MCILSFVAVLELGHVLSNHNSLKRLKSPSCYLTTRLKRVCAYKCFSCHGASQILAESDSIQVRRSCWRVMSVLNVQVRMRNGARNLPDPMVVKAGEDAYVFLRSYDEFGNPRRYRSAFDMDAHTATMQGVDKVHVRNLNNGAYHVVFVPTVVGAYSLNLFLSLQPGATVPILVTHGPFYAKATTVSPASSTTVAGIRHPLIASV